MLEAQNFLDVQLVFTRTAVLRDFVYQHRDFGDWRIHPVEQAQFKWNGYLLKPFRPVGFDLAVLDLLGARDDLRQPLAFNRRRDPVVAFSHTCSRRQVKPECRFRCRQSSLGRLAGDVTRHAGLA